jgi:hypothetical protein
VSTVIVDTVRLVAYGVSFHTASWAAMMIVVGAGLAAGLL